MAQAIPSVLPGPKGWGRGGAGLQGAGGVPAPPGPLRRWWGAEGIEENEASGRAQGELTKAISYRTHSGTTQGSRGHHPRALVPGRGS